MLFFSSVNLSNSPFKLVAHLFILGLTSSRSVIKPPMDLFPGASSKEEGELESAEESVELSVGQNWDSESANLMESTCSGLIGQATG